MRSKSKFLTGKLAGDIIILDSPPRQITPQPEPTSPRIKELLSRGLTAPETLTAAEVQEMAASVVYHMIKNKKG